MGFRNLQQKLKKWKTDSYFACSWFTTFMKSHFFFICLGIRAQTISLLSLLFHSSHFSFLVSGHFWQRSNTKKQKYYGIFVDILQGKMEKAGKKWKENHAMKVTKMPQTKRQKYGMNKIWRIWHFWKYIIVEIVGFWNLEYNFRKVLTPECNLSMRQTHMASQPHTKWH